MSSSAHVNVDEFVLLRQTQNRQKTILGLCKWAWKQYLDGFVINQNKNNVKNNRSKHLRTKNTLEDTKVANVNRILIYFTGMWSAVKWKAMSIAYLIAIIADATFRYIPRLHNLFEGINLKSVGKEPVIFPINITFETQTLLFTSVSF